MQNLGIENTQPGCQQLHSVDKGSRKCLKEVFFLEYMNECMGKILGGQKVDKFSHSHLNLLQQKLVKN